MNQTPSLRENGGEIAMVAPPPTPFDPRTAEAGRAVQTGIPKWRERAWWGGGESAVRRICVFWLIVASFPGPWFPAGPGADASYTWALNQGAVLGLVHGRDIVFNYGPFGWLAFPMDMGSNLLRGIAVHTGVWLLVAGGLAVLLGRRRAPAVTGAAVAGYLAALGLGLGFEYRLLFGLAVLFMLALEVPRTQAILLGSAGGALAVATLFLKFSTGIGALILLAVYEISLWNAPERRRWLPLLAAPAAATAALLSVVAFHHGSAATFFRWLGMSFEIASGYGVAMSLSGPVLSLYLAQISLLTAMAGIVAFIVLADRRGVFQACLLLVPLLLAYKHGFVRQATHATLYFTLAVAVAGALPLAMPPGRSRRVVYLVSVAVGGLALAGQALGPGFPAAFLARASGWDGLRQISHLAHLSSTRADMIRAGSTALEPDRLPELWVAQMKFGSVDVVPYETNVVPANGLAWAPNPILQTYNAYTRPLDGLSAAHFAGAAGPTFVLLEMATIDLRHPLLDAPATTLALLRHYRTLAVDEPHRRVLLRRIDRGVPDVEPTERDRGTLTLGEWVAVPAGPGLHFLAADFRLTTRGRVEKLLLKVPAVAMEVEYLDGQVVPIRILPETASAGLLLSHVPRTAGGAGALFAALPTDQVRRFRIGGLGAERYGSEVPFVWRTEPIPAKD